MRTTAGPARRVRTVLLALCFCLTAGGAGAQEARPSEETLRSIETRGRRIAVYIAARQKARERLQQEAGGLLQSDQQVVIEKKEGTWRVVFIRTQALASPAQNLVGVAETEYNPGADEVGAFKKDAAPRPLPVATAAYVRAIQVAIGVAAKRPELKPPFVESVFKEPDNLFSVYIQSKPEEGLARFGGDARMRVSPDGLMMVGIEPLHADITDIPIPAHASAQPTLHSHATGEYPTDTDVALILMHPTLAPHLVLTPAWIFRIDPEGHITWLGPNRVPPPRPAPAAPSDSGGGS